MRKRILSILSCFLVVMTLTACNNIFSSKNYRSEFTETEMNEGNASFNIMKNLKIDAKVTPYSMYEDGINSYYMEYYHEDTTDEIYGTKLDVFISDMEKELNAKSEIVNEVDNDVKKFIRYRFIRDNKEVYYMNISWSKDFRNDNMYYFPYVDLYPDDECEENGINNTLINDGYDIMIMDWLENSPSDLEFADIESSASAASQFMEKLLGRKICDTWDCITVDEESLNALDDVVIDYPLETTDVDGFYEFSFYYDIDGFPYDNLKLIYNTEGAEYTEEAGYLSAYDNVLTASNELSQQVAIGDNGIIKLSTSNFRYQGDVYKEYADIILSNDVLKLIEEYYSDKDIEGQLTIKQIRLIYSSYFTDKDTEQKVDNLVCPFWKVVIYDEVNCSNIIFAFDVVTGEILVENQMSNSGVLYG